MSRRNTWIVTAVTVIACLPIRLYQIFALADQSTGFYTDGGVTSWILFGLLAISVILTVFMTYSGAAAQKQQYRPIRSIPAAVLGIFAGLGLAVQSLVSMAADGSLNNTMYMILSLLGMLAGVVFMITAYDFATQQNHFDRHPLFSLIPPIWGCICLVALFISYVSVVNVTDNLLNTFTVIFLLLFLFAQAKLLAGVDTEKSSRMVYVFGMPAVAFSVLTGAADTTADFAGKVSGGTFPTGLHLVTLVMAAYIVCFLAALRRMPEAQEQLPESEPVRTEAGEDAEPPVMTADWNGCAEFLTKKYQSEIRFSPRVPSPFVSNKI